MAKILIAEDEKDIRDLVVFSLTYGGFEAISAFNGADAVVKAKEELPDLILMDVRMPTMSGYEACEELKQYPATRNIPIVFLSAKGQEAEIKKGLSSGAEEYILKPFAPDELIKRVQEILRRIGKG
jgi:DNA-binding response OmpR family regulator